jgi:hypothetical protein
MATDDDRSARDDVAAVVRAVLARARDAASGGAEVVGAGVDDAVRALVDRRIERALRRPGPATSSTDLAEVLGSGGGSAIARRAGATSAWLAGRTRAARFVGGRTPVGVALALAPVLYDAVAANLRGLDAAASHLVARARQHGVEPDPDRVRAALVQALSGAAVDPRDEPDHTALVRVWLADAGRQVLPPGLSGIKALGRGRTPDAVAATLARVDVRHLGGR